MNKCRHLISISFTIQIHCTATRTKNLLFDLELLSSNNSISIYVWQAAEEMNTLWHSVMFKSTHKNVILLPLRMWMSHSCHICHHIVQKKVRLWALIVVRFEKDHFNYSLSECINPTRVRFVHLRKLNGLRQHVADQSDTYIVPRPCALALCAFSLCVTHNQIMDSRRKYVALHYRRYQR